jgi:hypothetical protein
VPTVPTVATVAVSGLVNGTPEAGSLNQKVPRRTAVIA